MLPEPTICPWHVQFDPIRPQTLGKNALKREFPTVENLGGMVVSETTSWVEERIFPSVDFLARRCQPLTKQ